MVELSLKMYKITNKIKLSNHNNNNKKLLSNSNSKSNNNNKPKLKMFKITLKYLYQ